MRPNIISETNRRLPRRKIVRLTRMIDEAEDAPGGVVNIIFARDRKLAALNREYRGHAGATDVLSFNIDDDNGPESVFGEIYISTDTALKNLKEFGGTIQSELLRLCCHGLLHLLGYDHRHEKDAMAMRQREDCYLRRLSRC